MERRLACRTIACRTIFRTVALCVVLALLALSSGIALGAGRAGDVTVRRSVAVESLTDRAEIPLVQLFAARGEQDVVALGLAWRLVDAGWFPTWRLQLTSELGLLPGVESARGQGTVDLAQLAPRAGHEYGATLSYSPAAGALAVQVVDVTEGRVIYGERFSAPAYHGTMVAVEGDVRSVYLPLGTTWDIGLREESGLFVPVSKFPEPDARAVVRFVSPDPAPPGEYRLFLESGTGRELLADVPSAAGEAWVELDLTRFPLGASLVALEYAQSGETLLREARAITLGQLEATAAPVEVDRERGIGRIPLSVRSAHPISTSVRVTVRSVVSELVWNPDIKAFDAVPYAEVAYDVELGRDGAADIVLDFALPDRPGSWRLNLGFEADPALDVRPFGAEQLFSTHREAEVAQGDPYTFVVLPDTQYMVEEYPHIFTRMTDWVAANAAERNIVAVLHVGDITNRNTADQWERARAGMSLLHGVVPYVLALGNHDMGTPPHGLTERGRTLLNDYFSVEMAERYSNLGGTMVDGRLDNHYALISVPGTDYIVISLEFGAPDEAVAWAREVAERHPDHRLILLTHSYTSSGGGLSASVGTPLAENPNTTVSSGRELFYGFVSQQANSFMVVSGHTPPSVPVVPYRIARTVAGNPVVELLFDYQNQDDGGAGWLGLLTFHPDGTLEVQVYSPYLDAYSTAVAPSGFAAHMLIDLASGTAHGPHRER